MFKLTKSKYPNWWFLVQLSFICTKRDDVTAIHNMCGLIHRSVIGIMYALLMPFVISGAILIVTEFPIALFHGLHEPVYFANHPILDLTYFLSGALWIICVSLIVIISMFLAFCSLWGFVVNHKKLALGSKLKTTFTLSTNNPLRIWYHDFKQKYCPTVEVRNE